MAKTTSENDNLFWKSSNVQHSFGGSWTRRKLEVLEKYFAAFNNALSKQKFTRLYIDAFAGTGRCDIKVAGEKKSIDGSARRALATVPSFHEFYFIELRPKKLNVLNALKTEYPNKIIHVIQGDTNTTLKALCEQQVWNDKRAVLFLDPFGMQVEWGTLEAIAKTGSIDVWYLFPYSALYRQVPKNARALDADKETALTRTLGTSTWRNAFYDENRQQDLFTDNTNDVRHIEHWQMLEFVSTLLKGLFPAVTDPKVLYKNSNPRKLGSPLFALYFAASNPSPKAYRLATKIARDILDKL